jgi:SAM-dependent methyltransferase
MRGVNVTEHNRRQRRYFERGEKHTMVPRDTPYIRRHVAEVIRLGGLSRSDRILEVGCGMGRYTLALAERGLRVEGLDLTPFLLERLREYDGGRFAIPLHCLDIVDAPAELGGRFDAVLALFTLHHVHDLQPAITAMAALLRPGGRVVFLEPNPYNPLYYLQIAATPGMSWEGDGGIVRMRPAVLRAAAEAAGLERFRYERFGFFPPFAANQPLGSRLERALERIPVWRPLLPFQLFRADRRA